MFYDTAKGDHGLPYNPFKAIVTPRPIAWISTLGVDGIVNLAPDAMCNHLAYDPPFIFFSGSGRPSGRSKDSVINAEQTGEFVYNMATWELRDKVNKTAEVVPPEVDEMEYAGLTRAPSRLVRPPRVAESPVHLECKYHVTLTLPGDRPDTMHRVVVGRVVGVHIRDDMITDGRVDIVKIRPLARIGYMDYTSVESVFTMMPTGDRDPRTMVGDRKTLEDEPLAAGE